MRRLLAAGMLTAALVSAPSVAAARLTVTVELASGAVVGGLTIYLFVRGTWEMPLREGRIPTALVEVRDGRARWGLPVPAIRTVPSDGRATRDLQLDLLRLRF